MGFESVCPIPIFLNPFLFPSPMAKTQKEKFKTYGDVFDSFTKRNLFFLSSHHLFEESTLSPVSIGKESNVFSAKSSKGSVIIKIYRLETSDFNKMYYYIRNDPRFPTIKHNRRKIIFSWVQREYRNLLKAREAGIKVPTPFAFLSNILVMEQIGPPSPKLKDLLPDSPSSFYKKSKQYDARLYRAGLVHGDLSEFNILNLDQTPVFIDLSHATSISNPISKELLERDVKNLCRFFSKLGLKLDNEKELKEIIKSKPFEK